MSSSVRAVTLPTLAQAGSVTLEQVRAAFDREVMRCSLHINHVGRASVHPEWLSEREHARRMAHALLPAQGRLL